jgi:hypothetical protein
MSNLLNSTPLTEFPCLSNLGEKVAKPQRFGTTIIRPHHTQDFAGIHTLKAYSHEKSYMPQEYMTDKQFFTVFGENIFSLVIGHIPPFASVAATFDIWLVSNFMEQH